ncbi:DAK2 domain-containing protein, partial [Kitasatospora sp. NPDC001132]
PRTPPRGGPPPGAWAGGTWPWSAGPPGGGGGWAPPPAAEQGALDTVPLRARKGRASYLGDRSIGHQDPGATSTALVFRTLADVTAT